MYIVIALIALVFVVLTGVVIARLQKVLKSINRSDEYSAVPSGNKVNGALFIVILVLGAVSITWSYLHAREFFLPEASSIHGRRTDDLFWFSMGILTIPFIIVNFLIFFFSWKYQHKPNTRASFYPENHRLELIWTIVPAIVMALLVFTGWRAWSDITSEAPKDAEVIEITGKQFNWIVRYGGVKDNTLGDYNYKLIDSQNEVGIDLSDENSFDDFTTPSEMHIPVNRPVLLKIRARDVLHSVFIPHMRVKMDAVPGLPTRFWFVPDKSTADMRAELNNPNFDYEIACTEVCGQGHFSMKIRLIVEDEASYKKWCAEQPSFLQTYPEYLAKVPENLKAKAMKFVPAEAATPAADSSAASGSVGGGASSLR
ncbi:cytochrome c oxidase subunit II [Dyadobacter sandarakinus]|uniref:Cytochrome c oxidase subunit 2 n=1 Tax=Dyadobacter sandarakinus TaxID=2747268 RepID=A0ABX7IBF4_9BACT|nr:cytochrome c oxidase subunit II [Dyadobacter sandarakinus]QRR03143.1 cytochrome c oxidase subunit II [Dyadobacter sandarakinus]